MEELNQETEVITNDTDRQEEEKLFTQADIEEIITKRLTREKAKMEKEAEKAKQLAAMSAEEKLMHEIEERDKRLAEYEGKEKLAILKDKASTTFNSYGIDTSLAHLVIGADEDETIRNANVFKEKWEAALKVATDKALAGTTPVKPNIVEQQGITKKEFSKMSIMEKQKLYQEDRELYKKLSK